MSEYIEGTFIYMCDLPICADSSCIVSSVCYLSPILEMVTEKYLLREEEEWRARHESMKILDDLLLAIRRSDIKTIARLVTEK